MDMLLRQTSINELADILHRHADRSPVPALREEATVRRARRIARKNGLWETLSETLDPAGPVTSLRWSDYQDFFRTGSRKRCDPAILSRRKNLRNVALAVWLGHPAGELDYLQDLIWSICEESWWCLAPHNQRDNSLDLVTSQTAEFLAILLHVLGDRLEEQVVRRVRDEIRRRVFDAYHDYDHPLWWKTCNHNWNLVCNAGLIWSAVLLCENCIEAANLIHEPMQNMTYALDGFTEDGGCQESVSYWQYGFGQFMKVAVGLYDRTGGEVNLLADPKIERIARFPLAVCVDSAKVALYGDGTHVQLTTELAGWIHRFFNVPELFGLCRTDPTGRPMQDNWHSLAMRFPQRFPGLPRQDVVLEDLGLGTLRGGSEGRQTTLVVTALDNCVNHGHKDAGSFMLYRDGEFWIDDPGGPRYNARTFQSAERYKILRCRTLAHSLPILNGHEQGWGPAFRCTLRAEELDGDEKVVTVDLGGAYPRKAVRSFVRQFRQDAADGSVEICDELGFARQPRSIEEGFITRQKVKVARGGRSVRIGTQKRGLSVTAPDTPGRFTVQQLEEDPEDAKDDQPIYRIGFEPATLARQMTLRFLFR